MTNITRLCRECLARLADADGEYCNDCLEAFAGLDLDEDEDCETS